MLIVFSENQKKMLFENAVASVETLRDAKDQADQFCKHAGKELYFDQHALFILSAVTNHDSQFVPDSDREKCATLN